MNWIKFTLAIIIAIGIRCPLIEDDELASNKTIIRSFISDLEGQRDITLEILQQLKTKTKSLDRRSLSEVNRMLICNLEDLLNKKISKNNYLHIYM